MRVLIITNHLAIGIDLSNFKVLINYDVPTLTMSGERHGDSDTYLHRITRIARPGVKGIAITLYDRDIQKTYFDEIMNYFGSQDKVKVFEGPGHLADVLKKMNQ